jgi:Opacity protein and related surface antigens
MVNGLLDFGDDHSLNGFVGGGLGVARVKAQDWRINENRAGSDQRQRYGIRVQVIAGIRYPVTDQIDIGAKYRYVQRRSRAFS